MLQQERIDDHQEALRLAFNGLARTLWCAMIGIVTDTSNFVEHGTVKVEIVIQAMVSDAQGVQIEQTIKPLVDVPVVFLGGGSMVATFPVSVGDEALIVFADRAIDFWFARGGVQRPAETRAHSLSDGIAIVGPRSLARSLVNLSSTSAQFRTIDASTFVEIAPGGVVNIVAPGGLNISGPVDITGDVNVTGSVTASEEGTFNSIPVSTHLHGGVQTGGSDTGTPIA
jgi:hypothetical protein